MDEQCCSTSGSEQAVRRSGSSYLESLPDTDSLLSSYEPLTLITFAGTRRTLQNLCPVKAQHKPACVISQLVRGPLWVETFFTDGCSFSLFNFLFLLKVIALPQLSVYSFDSLGFHGFLPAHSPLRSGKWQTQQSLSHCLNEYESARWTVISILISSYWDDSCGFRGTIKTHIYREFIVPWQALNKSQRWEETHQLQETYLWMREARVIQEKSESSEKYPKTEHREKSVLCIAQKLPSKKHFQSSFSLHFWSALLMEVSQFELNSFCLFLQSFTSSIGRCHSRNGLMVRNIFLLLALRENDSPLWFE